MILPRTQFPSVETRVLAQEQPPVRRLEPNLIQQHD